MKSTLCSIVLGALLLLTQMHATAAEVGISPTRAQLSSTRRVETLTLRNTGSVPVEYQVSVKRWRMAEHGRWVYEDATAQDGLVVFPLAFSVAPSKSQVIRVGLAKGVAPSGPERSYRIFIREMPKAVTPQTTRALDVLTQLSLPVFIHDGAGKPVLRLEGGAIRDGKWGFSVAAQNGHLDPTPTKVRFLDGDGAVIAEQDVQIGYVLDGATLPLTTPVTPAVCTGGVRYEVQAPAPFGEHEGALPPLSQRACGG